MRAQHILFVTLVLLATRPGLAQDAAPAGPSAETQQGRAWIAHLPISSAPIEDVRLRFDVRGADLSGEIVVYYRPSEQRGGSVLSVRAQRFEQGYGALLPASSITSDTLVYWVVERDPKGEERAVFASAAAPQPVHVYVDDAGAREKRLLRLAGGRRSRVTGKFDWVDMGNYQLETTNAEAGERDRYYQIEALYGYRFYRMVEELEVALGWLDGDLLDTDSFERERVALAYGRSAITFAFGEWVRLRPGMLLGISTVGFELGGDLALVLGHRDGTEFEISGGIVGRLGGKVGVRLGWSTVPHVPMGARLELTNFPNNDEFGVRMLFDAGYRFGAAALLKVVAGYRGRTSLTGGPSIGAEGSYEF